MLLFERIGPPHFACAYALDAFLLNWIHGPSNLLGESAEMLQACIHGHALRPTNV